MSKTQGHHLLGIVVPVFNTEDRYLINCFESLRQDDDDYCVAVVDDGSEYRTARLCSSYAEAYGDTFVYLRQDNAGQNAARNAGWRALAADYTMFVDSDDMLAEGSIGLLCRLLRDFAPDVLRFDHKVCVDIEDCPNAIDRMEKVRTHRPPKEVLIANQCSLWGVAIATSQLSRHPLVEGFHIGEDLASIVPILACADSIIDLDESLYGYVQRPTSVTQKERYAFPLEILSAFECFDDLGLSSEWSEEIEWQAIKHLLYWEPMRIIKAGAPMRGARKALFGYVNKRFPNWRRNPYLGRESALFGFDFQLLLSGRWKLYQLLCFVKSGITNLRENRRQQ